MSGWLPQLEGREDGEEIFYEAAEGIFWHLRWIAEREMWLYLGGPSPPPTLLVRVVP